MQCEYFHLKCIHKIYIYLKIVNRSLYILAHIHSFSLSICVCLCMCLYIFNKQMKFLITNKFHPYHWYSTQNASKFVPNCIPNIFEANENNHPTVKQIEVGSLLYRILKTRIADKTFLLFMQNEMLRFEDFC